MNKKAATHSVDFTETLIAIIIIAIALFMLFFVANQREAKLSNAITQIESDAIRMQAARTFVQTPVLFNNEEKTVGELLNMYYALKMKAKPTKIDSRKESDLRSLIFDTAKLNLRPLIEQDIYEKYIVVVQLYEGKTIMSNHYWLELLPGTPRVPTITYLDLHLPTNLHTPNEEPGDYTIVIHIE